MAGRTRSRVLSAMSGSYQTLSFYSTSEGGCDTDPGPIERPWGWGVKSGSVNTLYSAETMTDVEVPGFYKERAKGKIFNNPMCKTFYVTTSDIFPVNIEFTSSMLRKCNPTRLCPVNNHVHYGTLCLDALIGSTGFLPVSSEIDEAALISIATTQSYAQIGHDELLSLSAIAESNKTLSGMIDILKIVNRSMLKTHLKHKKLLKGSRKNDETLASDIRELYMNARYNLRPCYYDMRALYRILTNAVDKPGRQTYRGYASDSSYNSDVVTPVVFSQGGANVKLNVSRVTTEEISVRAGVLTESGQVSNFQIWGFDSIVESAWDLMPYSFILDWFFNVGNSIMALTPKFGIKDLASWAVVRKQTSQKCIVEEVDATFGPYSSYVYTGNASIPVGSQMTKFTKVLTRIPNPKRNILPSFYLKLDPLKILDLGIILKGFKKQSLKSYTRTM